MKILVSYYSRTQHTEAAAVTISDRLNCDREKIVDKINRNGPIGFLRSGYQAIRGTLVELEPAKCNPSAYDLVIIGTPIWAGRVSSPVRTYIHKFRDDFEKVAFFCTCGDSGAENTFAQMESLCGKSPVGVLTLTQLELENKDYVKKVEDFLHQIKAALQQKG